MRKCGKLGTQVFVTEVQAKVLRHSCVAARRLLEDKIISKQIVTIFHQIW